MESPESILIQVDRLSRYYDTTCAVNKVSFDVRQGEVLGFLGPNGAGKSTTMQMICGALAPSAGRIEIAGVDLLDQPLAAKAHIGFLPENPPVYVDMTVTEYLRFCARLRGTEKAKLQTALVSAVERCGLGDVRHRLIGNLSKGYQQRVGIAQAIIHNPKVVVLDEPTVGLDPNQIREIRELIRTLGEDHCVILSTHILPEVQATCTRVQIINCGRLVYSKSMDDLGEQLQSASVLVGLSAPPSPEALAGLPGIGLVEPLEPGRFRLHFAAQEREISQLAASIVNAGWGLRELVPERRTLEQIFTELTTGEEATHGEETA